MLYTQKRQHKLCTTFIMFLLQKLYSKLCTFGMYKQWKLNYTCGIFLTLSWFAPKLHTLCDTKNVPHNDMNIKNISLATQKHIKKKSVGNFMLPVLKIKNHAQRRIPFKNVFQAE